MATEFDHTIRDSRLADSFGAACANAALATRNKSKIKDALLRVTEDHANECVLFVGERYDVTVTPTSTTTVDWEALARRFAANLKVGAPELASLIALHTKTAEGVRVCAKARVAREGV
jgi:hypothetical protein